MKNHCEHIYCPTGCTVRSGMCERCVVAARSALAQKVLETVEAQRAGLNSGVYHLAIDDTLTALRELFQKEGVEVSG